MMPHEPLAVITPLIHLNGDRRETLLDNLEALYKALRAADLALAVCRPNGRNFYPDPGRIDRAEHQHHERQAHLRALIDSVCAEAEQIQRETSTR